jgi:hypothetical protein
LTNAICHYPYSRISQIYKKKKLSNNEGFLFTNKIEYKIKRSVLVTRVSRVALSSGAFGLNNLDEITYDKNYSTICGFTEKELLDNFSNRYNLVL